jgi:hypothetical protein
VSVLQLTLKAKMITIDEVTLPVIASTICKNASTLRVQILNDSLAKKPINTQDANKRAIRTLDTKDKKSRSPVKSQRQLQASKCQLSNKSLQLLIKYELLFDGTLGDWKTKPVSFQAN